LRFFSAFLDAIHRAPGRDVVWYVPLVPEATTIDVCMSPSRESFPGQTKKFAEPPAPSGGKLASEVIE
jgi:hypothetical protein